MSSAQRAAPATRRARLVRRRPGTVVVVWLMLAVAAASVAPGITPPGTTASEALLPSGSSSEAAQALLDRAFPGEPGLDSALVVAARPGGLKPSDHAYLEELATALAGSPGAGHVRSVYSVATHPELAAVLRSPDGEATLIVADLVPGGAAVAFLRERLTRVPAGLRLHLSGLAGLNSDQTVALGGPVPWPALVGLLLLVGALTAVLRRSLAAAVVVACTAAPALVVARAAVVTLLPDRAGAAGLVGIFVPVVILVLVSDHVALLFEHAMRRPAAGDSGAGLVSTKALGAAAAGWAGLAGAMVAFAPARLEIYRWLGVDIAVALIVTAAAALTLSPALTVLVGGRGAFAARLRIPARAVRVTRHPEMVLAGATTLLVVAAIALIGFQPSTDPAAGLPPASEARQGFDTLNRHFPPGLLSPAYVVVDAGGPVLDARVLTAVDSLTDDLRADSRLAGVRSITQPAGAPLTLSELPALLGGEADPRAIGIDPDVVDITPLFERLTRPGGLRLDADLLASYPQLRARLGFFLSEDGRTTRLVVTPHQGPDAPATRAALSRLEDRARSTLARFGIPAATVAVGGPGMASADLAAAASAETMRVGVPLGIGAVGIMIILTGSAALAAALAVAAAASFAAAAGVSVVLVQHGLGEPGLPFWLPLITVVVAAVAAVNSAILVRSRREPGQRIMMVEGAGRDRMVLAGALAALALAPVPAVRPAGLTLALGVLLNSLIVGRLVLPAAAVLSGAPGRRSRAGSRPGRLVLGGASALTVVMVAVLVGGPVRRGPVEESTAGESTAGVFGPLTATTALSGPQVSDPPAHPGLRLTSVTVTSRAGVRTAVTSGGDLTVPPPPAASPGGGTSPVVTTSTTPGPAVEGPVPGRAAAGPAPAASSPEAAAREGIAVPALGGWRYRLEGSWSAGLAGTPRPFEEEVVTEVSRRGGTDDEPELGLITTFEAGRYEEVRRYRPEALELLSARFSSPWLSFGGAFSTPLLLLPWPPEGARSWRVEWTTKDGWGESNFTLAGRRVTAVAGRSFNCHLVTAVTTFHGSTEGKEEMEACWVQELGMSADDHHTFDGTHRGVRLQGRWRSRLLSLSPDS